MEYTTATLIVVAGLEPVAAVAPEQLVTVTEAALAVAGLEPAVVDNRQMIRSRRSS